MTTAITLIGLCTFYSPNLMETVYANRLAWGHVQPCPECIGFAAMVEPEYLGQRVWIARPDERAEGPFLVVDVGKAEHREGQRRRGLVCEVDFQTAQRWKMRGPVRVRVSMIGAQRGATP